MTTQVWVCLRCGEVTYPENESELGEDSCDFECVCGGTQFKQVEVEA